MKVLPFQLPENVQPSVKILKSDSLTLWNTTPPNRVPLNTISTLTRQLQKEAEVDNLMENVDSVVHRARGRAKRPGKKECLEIRNRIQQAIVQLLHSFDCVIDTTMETEFSAVTDDFIRHAYDFDPDIGDEPLYQAARNVLIMNTLQMHLGKEISLTPSVFAYSMLYPYTDNYLDRADIQTGSKHDANNWLLLRLNGVSVHPRNRNEEIIDRLVAMIEQEFDRDAYPSVFESLLAIHHAQILSVSQTDDSPLPLDQLLDISLEKGGTSVLADGYLVSGTLSEADATFLFRFGFLLQLVDDLQDIEEDDRNKQRTLVGVLASLDSLDAFTSHLLSFLETVVGPDPQEFSHVDPKLRKLIERSCRLLIFEAVALNEKCYNSAYIAMIEHHSPVRFSYLREVHERLGKVYNSRRMIKSARVKNGFHQQRKKIFERFG